MGGRPLPIRVFLSPCSLDGPGRRPEVGGIHTTIALSSTIHWWVLLPCSSPLFVLPSLTALYPSSRISLDCDSKSPRTGYARAPSSSPLSLPAPDTSPTRSPSPEGPLPPHLLFRAPTIDTTNMHPALSPDFNPPPPTFNTLDSHQKIRLIRTTRKLGAVLGTTPHFAETISPASFPLSRPLPIGEKEKPLPRPVASKHDRKRRQGSVFEFSPPSKPFAYDYASSSASSSAASLALPRSSTDSSNSDASTQSLPTPRSFARHVREKSKSSNKRAPLPTPLVLRLNAVALPPSDPRLATPPSSGVTLKHTTTTTGLSPNNGSGSGGGSGNRTTMPVTPTTPGTPATPTVTETRRKRLAKLKRTLGENVPAELVIPTPRATYSRRASPLEGPSAAAGQALAPFPLMSAPQTQAEYDRPYQTMHMPVHGNAQVKPPPRTQKTYPPALAYAMPTSSSPARTSSSSSPRQRSVSVDFKRGGFGFAASAPVTPHREPSPKPKSKPKAQAHLQPQQQQQQIRRAPSLSARHPPAWSPPRRVASPDSGSGSESGHGRANGNKNGKGWATGGTSWMGEWNRKDIHEVQRQLRNLKLR